MTHNKPQHDDCTLDGTGRGASRPCAQMVQPAHSNLTGYNWLIYKIHDAALRAALDRHATGILVDIGCGVKPYRPLTDGLVRRHVGLDHAGSPHSHESVDILATAYDTGLASNCVDTVLCTVVLEHVEEPQAALAEMYRILRPGGTVILSAPLFWHLHEEPRDFYRYTRYGLEYLFGVAGLEVIRIEPLAGFIVTFAQEMCYYLEERRHNWLRYPVRLAQGWLQWAAYSLHQLGLDKSPEYTWAYLAVARKPAHI